MHGSMNDSGNSFLFASAAAGEVAFWKIPTNSREVQIQNRWLVFEGSPTGAGPDDVGSLSWNHDSILNSV